MLPPDLPFLSLVLAACIAGAFTPGPNNTICMTVAINFGFWRALPFAGGVMVGFPLLLAATGAGLGEIIDRQPQLHWAIKIGGALFLLHMSWKIAMSRTMGGGGKKVPGFIRAVLFQWINPKAVTYAISVVAAFVRPGETWVSDMVYLIMLSGLVSFASTLTWAGFGVGIGKLLATERALAIFNGIMGAMLALSALAVLLV